MAAIACFSVQDEVSVLHLRQYLFLMSSAWNSSSKRFVMMFSYVPLPTENAGHAGRFRIPRILQPGNSQKTPFGRCTGTSLPIWNAGIFFLTGFL